MKKFLLSIFCLFSLVGFATAEEATLSFADKANRTVFNANQQVWEQNGITLTNNKAASTNAVADYANPARFYKSSELIVETTQGMSKIVFNCNNTSYATDLQKSIGEGATVSSKDVTVELNGETSYTIAKLTAQVRLNSLVVTFAEVAEAEVATPIFSVEAGTQYNPFSVEISAEEGATVYYTLDGTEPTTESAVYSEAIAFNEFGTSTTLKAVAAVDGELSNIASATYSLEVAAPTFSVKGGVYEKLTGETALKFTCETEGATIYYNNRGGDPITAGSKSYGSLSVLATAEVKAVAFVENAEGEKIYSAVASEKYYISAVKPFEKVTEFAAGEYLIHANGFAATALSETGNYGYLPQFAVAANGNFIETNAFYAFTFTAVEGGYTIQDTFGRYVYQTGTYNSFNVAAEMPETGAVWTVAIDETTGEATITNVAVNKYIQYSASYTSYGSYSEVKGVKPSLYKLGEYPTMTVTPENWATVPAFEKVTITCEGGIAYNENDENYPYYTIGWDGTPYEFDNVVVVDENTIELTFDTPIQENGDYRVILPAGLFILNPNGLAMASEKVQNTITVDNPNVLEVVYANPDNEAKVKSIEYLYFEFNQDIFDNVNGAVITNENGEEFPLTVTYTDSWGDNTPYNVLCLKTAEPITAPGVYTFVLKKEYVHAGTDIRISNDITYTFTISEGLKITNISPVAGTEVSAIDEIIIECNQEITCWADAFLVMDENGTEYYFAPTFQDKDGNELPYNMVRLVTETPITAAGTYTLFIEDYNIANTDWMNQEVLPRYEYVFTFDGSSITTGIDNVEGENGVNVIYDLTGRKIENITKAGIYIINGKKVLVK
ncbi:MAG: chitobiase/beta-hexosaminidase C-terminal domain-containing protein [Bacteroidaceae bacterium]|nr:chitobiase/beta-hexosaminidase C-terminal domain-containing protein [Bacteroidaceae bacterium]